MKPTKKRVVRVKAWAVLEGNKIGKSGSLDYDQCQIFPNKHDAWEYARRLDLIVPCTISYQLPATKGREVKRVKH